MFDEFGFPHRSEHVALAHLVARFGDGNEMPLLFTVEIVDRNAARNAVAALEVKRRKRTLNPVENTRDEPRRKFGGKRFARGNDILAGT